MIDNLDTHDLDTKSLEGIAASVLDLGASFDWITPLVNWMQGYNRATVGGVGFDEAYIEQMRLKGLGIKSRIEGNFGSYRVVVRG